MCRPEGGSLSHMQGQGATAKSTLQGMSVAPHFVWLLQNRATQTTSAFTNMADLPKALHQPTTYMWT